jgi:hypothetical protein
MLVAEFLEEYPQFDRIIHGSRLINGKAVNVYSRGTEFRSRRA